MGLSENVTVQRDGFALSATVSGRESAPWLLLANSLGTTQAMWEPQRQLLDRRYRVLSFDTRGHGESGFPAGPYAFDDLVEDVVAVMDRFEIGTANYLGLSLGGMTGLGLALRHPDRIERLVCCNARADAPPAFIQGWDDRLASVEKGGLAAIVSGTMERWFGDRWRNDNPEMLERFEKSFVGTSVDGYRGCVAALKELDYLKQLGRIRAPTLYVAGEYDLAAPVSAMQAMAAATPGCEIAIIAARHLSNVDNAAAFDAAIERFLRP